MIRPHLLALGAFALAVACTAGLGVASDEDSGEWELAPPEKRLDVFTMTVDGEVFEVSTPAHNPNQRDFEWLSGPNEGYGYSSAASAPVAWTKAELEEDIRQFLSMIDPATGYVGDD